MLAVLLAGGASACAVAYALAVHRRFVRSLQEALVGDDDELERRLAVRQSQLEHALARRQTLAAGRATLFAGTGSGVWALTGGSTHYLDGGLAFVAGMVGWMAAGEVHRRIGSSADLAARLKAAQRRNEGERSARDRETVDQDSGTG